MDDLPDENLIAPTTKSMSSLHLTLFDFSSNPPKRMTLEAPYPQDAPPESFMPDGLKVTITAGDNVVSGSVTVPVFMLYSLLMQLLQAHSEAKNSGLVGFDKPNLIVPN